MSPLPRLGRAAAAAAAAMLLADGAQAAAGPRLRLSRALELPGAPEHESLASRNQAMGVWREGASSEGRELLVALVHRYGDLDRRADDRQFAVAWESDGEQLREVQRVPMSCPDVELAVPARGPYVYEARLQATPWSLHPECACQPSAGQACPRGVRAEGRGSWSLRSPVDSHFVSLQNEWREPIGDEAVLGRLTRNLEAPLVAVSRPVGNATHGGTLESALGCPGTWDDAFGSRDVTLEQLSRGGMLLPVGHVQGSWCLVRRGGCSETAKVKVCELSGAVGAIIVDHGRFAGDQEVVVRYSRAAGEWERTMPILFVSADEGQRLAAEPPGSTTVHVGPAVGGPAPESFAPGSGIVVHALGASAPTSGPRRRAWPEVFGTAGWLEASGVRDLLFVCLPDHSEVRIFNVSRPLEEVPLVGKIMIGCSRWGLHDYRVLDYLGMDGRFSTLLIDPMDRGNRLYYFDTHDPSSPRLKLELHARWEAETDGLGQVRAGGPGGRYHMVTWHCADLYCGKSHGDSLYVLDALYPTRPALQVPLPMLSRGSFARDVACGADHLCLVSLAWDGLVAVDGGVLGTRNLFKVVAETGDEQPYGSVEIPHDMVRMRMHSGAQKVYASHLNARRFYVEHADFRYQPLRAGDTVRALQLREVYTAELAGYDASQAVPGPEPLPALSRVPGGLRAELPPAEGLGNEAAEPVVPVEVLLMALSLMALMFIGLLLLLLLHRPFHAQRLTPIGTNVVVGRPVENSSDVNAQPGQPVPEDCLPGRAPSEAWLA